MIEDQQISCSFCGKHSDGVEVMMVKERGSQIAICSECVELGYECLMEYRSKNKNEKLQT